ncbi:properdin-like [Tigriopus californicus]|uniref:properdin-like n=1 Tax=Tigriopus californicus TaxID=6832 RepID=UPI0027DA3D7B|nr:properdin-like [Tigriopus californicus]
MACPFSYKMGGTLVTYILLSSFLLANARNVEYFESGDGCGAAVEISLRSEPLDVADPKRCVMVKFPATAEFEAGIQQESYRIEDKIRSKFGSWGAWSEWSSCSETCGSGQKQRSRICNSDQPNLYCKGSATGVRYCLIVSCPVHGLWVEWSSWDACQDDCSLTLESRTRSCTNPAPKHGGDSCSGFSLDQRNCTSQAVCPGSWSSWTSWSQCGDPIIGDCGQGSKARSRACDNPAPRNGGEACGGSNQESLSCDIICEPPGLWNEWEPWSSCGSIACGPTPGQQSRSRTCGALPGAKPCPSEDPVEEIRDCPMDCKGYYLHALKILAFMLQDLRPGRGKMFKANPSDCTHISKTDKHNTFC